MTAAAADLIVLSRSGVAERSTGSRDQQQKSTVGFGTEYATAQTLKAATPVDGTAGSTSVSLDSHNTTQFHFSQCTFHLLVASSALCFVFGPGLPCHNQSTCVLLLYWPLATGRCQQNNICG